MIKEIKRKIRKRRNTINLKYISALEENKKMSDKIIELQDKVIRLQEDNDVYQKYIIEELEQDIVKIKGKKVK